MHLFLNPESEKDRYSFHVIVTSRVLLQYALQLTNIQVHLAEIVNYAITASKDPTIGGTGYYSSEDTDWREETIAGKIRSSQTSSGERQSLRIAQGGLLSFDKLQRFWLKEAR